MDITQPDYASLQSLIEQIENSTSVRSIIAYLAQFVGRYGFSTVGMGHVINPALHATNRSDVFQLSNWSKEWVDHWAGRNLIIRDPVARYSLLSDRPFRWREAFGHERTRDKDVEHLMHEFGFSDGVAIPHHTGDGPPGIVSLGADKFELNETETADIHLVCVHAYSKIERIMGSFPYQAPVNLTLREREILHFVAGGKTNWEIGQILSISEYSVRDHISAAAKKLGAIGRAHTVALAIRQGQILP